ncbi:MAG: hypothetical protein KF764_29930 [Labilithrix sp.]|nr:hypothetical protein [Labilithrix sp.]MBX3223504.1 hypothetical protein [Labilithrix sp.]
MKRPSFLPSPAALVSAVLLYVLLGAFGAVAAAVIPHLIELIATSPRLAMCGLLGLVISPGVVVALVHHVGHRTLDRAERKTRGLFPAAESCWAGAHAWLVLYGTSVLASLVMLVVDPPELEPEALALLASFVDRAGAGTLASVHTLVWILIAAALYELERRARPRRSTEA